MARVDGYDFYKSLGSPKLVLAPMVDHSELSWRLLARRKGAQLCYTPMYHSRVFTENPGYAKKHVERGTGDPAYDRPLIFQFCGNDPEVLVQASKMVEHLCDAVDINLGCPQMIAKRGHYGSFLMEEPELIKAIVERMVCELKVPVTCKIRIYPDVEKTIEYARMLETAGCAILTVHGRLREQKGPLTGLADWEQIKAVKQALKIPVIANGNIVEHGDLWRCLEATGCDGVMSAEGHLYNPFIFHSPAHIPTVLEAVTAYIDCVRKHPPPDDAFLRGHLFKIFRCALEEYPDYRQRLGTSPTIDSLCEFAMEFALEVDKRGIRCEPYYRYQRTIESAKSE